MSETLYDGRRVRLLTVIDEGNREGLEIAMGLSVPSQRVDVVADTAIYSPSGTSAGIGFAVPVDTVRRVVPQLIETGDYIPPQLGITVNQQVSAVVLARLRLRGVLVWEVQPDSGAAAAGVRGS